MPLTMRATGLSSSPVDKDRQDWTIFDTGEPVGRIYEDASASTPAELRWFWSVTVYVNPKAGIVTSGNALTLAVAKVQFETAWRQWLAWAKLQEML
jgi:hypothetical protein